MTIDLVTEVTEVAELSELCALIERDLRVRPGRYRWTKATREAVVSPRLVEEWLADSAPRAPGFGMIRKGEELPIADISKVSSIRRVSVPNIPDQGRILKRLAEGYTLILTDPETWCASLRAFTSRFAKFFDAMAKTTCILSPPDGWAFEQHVDDENVVVVQIAGRKRWVFVLEDETHTVTLEPGDVLYLPPNVPHQVFGESVGSLHLTIGLHFKSLPLAVSSILRETILEEVPHIDRFSDGDLHSALQRVARALEERAESEDRGGIEPLEPAVGSLEEILRFS